MSALHYRIGIFARFKLFGTLRKIGLASHEDVIHAGDMYRNGYSGVIRE